MSQSLETVRYLDIFAESGQQEFDPLEAYSQIAERYREGSIEHDDAADIFVKETQALWLDTKFLGLEQQANQIALLAHQMCGHNESLQKSLEYNGIHRPDTEVGHDHSKTNHEDELEKNGKKSNKTKKQKAVFSLLGLIFRP